MNLLYIAVGGALGAVLRYLAGNAAFDTFRIFRAGLCGKHVVRKDF